MTILAVVIATIIGAILYRMGGASGFNTKFRDIGIPVVGVALLGLWGAGGVPVLPRLLGLFLTFGLLFAAQTTYFKRKGTDAEWYHWALVGLANGVALLPYAAVTGQWVELGIRTAVLVVLVTAWCELITNAVLEECGRGALIIATLGIFL